VRRPSGYFIQKVAGLVADAVQRDLEPLEFGNLNFWCDWGSAREYMEILCDFMNMGDHFFTDFVLASGETINAAQLVRKVFQVYGLDAEDSIVDLYPSDLGLAPWRVDLSHMRAAIGRIPIVSIMDVLKEIIAQKLDNSSSAGVGQQIQRTPLR
jgi:GDP-D-mannose dehydratase